MQAFGSVALKGFTMLDFAAHKLKATVLVIQKVVADLVTGDELFLRDDKIWWRANIKKYREFETEGKREIKKKRAI